MQSSVAVVGPQTRARSVKKADGTTSTLAVVTAACLGARPNGLRDLAPSQESLAPAVMRAAAKCSAKNSARLLQRARLRDKRRGDVAAHVMPNPTRETKAHRLVHLRANRAMTQRLGQTAVFA